MILRMEDIYQKLQLVFAEGLYESEENFRTAEKNTATEGGVKYSRMSKDTIKTQSQFSYMKTFREQIADYQDGKIIGDDALVLGATPEVLKRIGLVGLPMTINQKHIKDALNGTYKGTQQEKLDHTFTAGELATLPEKIADPIAIIYDKRTGKANASESNIDVLVEMTVASGKQVIAAVQINSNGRINGVRMDTNKVSTVHGNTDSIARLVEAINENQKGNVAVFYLNKDKTTKVLQRTGNPIPSGLSNLDGFIHSIADSGSPVKMRFSSITETQQFKRWFGDWQKHPENASKVVNADGTPKVVYHGTDRMFNVFNTKAGTYWFSEYEDYAESMMEERGGGEVKAVYLDMKNPYRAKLPPGKFSDPTYEAPIIQEAMAGDYDGVIIENDTTDPLVAETFYVVFSPEQVKSATDNIGTFDGSNPDIRYAVRRKMQPTVESMLRKENAALRKDVDRLKELLQLQKTVTNGTVFKQSSVNTAANLLKKNNNASGNSQELAALLDDFYKYIANGEELTWEGVREKAMPAVNWLQEHVKQERSEYSQDVLNSLRGSRVYLDDVQKLEVAYRYGSVDITCGEN